MSLIELVVSIVVISAVISVALTGLLNTMSLSAGHGADPIKRKQALAIAEALIEEVEMMPFTTCDPDDGNASPCVATEAMGPENPYSNQADIEARGSATAPFDNVNDYNGFTLSGGGPGLGGAAGIVVPAGYSASVAVAQDGDLGPGGAQIPSTDALLITVTVTYEGGSIVLEGYRTRYAPSP